MTTGKVFFNMFQHIKSCVKHNGITSDFFFNLKSESDKGKTYHLTKKNSKWPTYIFNLQTDNAVGGELKDSIDDTTWLKLFDLLYADDTIILSNDKVDFQNCLNSFHQY